MTYPEKKLTQAIILAAGKGTRMNSELPKVLHKVGGKPMIIHLLETLKDSELEKVVVVVGYGKDQVTNEISQWSKNAPGLKIEFCEQKEQLGTGDAVRTAREYLMDDDHYLLVLLGDVPFIESSTIEDMFNTIKSSAASSVVLSTRLDNPTGYGRIVRNGDGNIKKIVEEKDATADEKTINEINTGIFIFQNNDLWKYIDELESQNAQKEYYLTDMVKILSSHSKPVATYFNDDYMQFMGINSVEQLAQMEAQRGMKA